MKIPVTEKTEILVIGGGAAGMAAALAACRNGKQVLLVEHDGELGGILRQCVHRGFGLAAFREDLTGREYAARFVSAVRGSDITVRTGTTVLSLEEEGSGDEDAFPCAEGSGDGCISRFTERSALLSGPEGLYRVSFDQCVLATGCRERNLGSLGLAGTRPAGIFTAGTAQQLMGRGGLCIGRRIVILGCGDFGMIMARQFTLAGLEVVAMIEKMDHPGGLARNRKECLEAFRIPVILRTVVDGILGEGRITGVMARDLQTGRRYEIACDTLVTAVGLIPDRTLCRGLERADGVLPSWLHLCGNCESVHDLVDSVSREAEALGRRL